MQIIRATFSASVTLSPARPLFGQQFYMSHNFTISGTFHLQPFICSQLVVPCAIPFIAGGIHLGCVCVNPMHGTFVAQTTVQTSTLNDIRKRERERACVAISFGFCMLSPRRQVTVQVRTTTTLSTVLHDAYIAFGLHAGNPDT